MTGANLNHALLIEANLKGAKLQWVNLRKADLNDADLREARFCQMAQSLLTKPIWKNLLNLIMADTR